MQISFRQLFIGAAITIAAPLPAAAPQGADSAEASPFELISTARFGERAVAVIAIAASPGSRRLVRMGASVGTSGYKLTTVDVDYVELSKDGKIITLTLDKADEASIARRKAAREAQEARAKHADENTAANAEKSPAEVAIAHLRERLSMELAHWELKDADAEAVAAAVRRWTAGEDGKAVSVRVLTNPAVEAGAVTASGENSSVQDVLNLLSKDFNMPYIARPDGEIVIGVGYRFKMHTIAKDDTLADIAAKYKASENAIAAMNSETLESGKRLIIPVPTDN